MGFFVGQSNTVATPRKIADIAFSSFAASTTYRQRFSGLNRNAIARTFMVVNKLKNQSTGINSNGNVYLVGMDSMFLPPTYNYSGSQSLGTLNYGQVGVFFGSILGTIAGVAQPLGGMDTIELQFPIGTTAPDNGNVEVWVVEMI
jgi:hypothetical protein